METTAYFFIAALAAFALDRATKLLAIVNLSFQSVVRVLRGVLEWRLTRNDGMALGIFSGHTLAVLLLPAITVLVGWLALRRYRATTYIWVATGLVAGGFLGNLLDRLLFGFVLDMVYFPWMPWYVCNFADIAICAGVAMLAISLLWRPRDWVRKTEAKAREAHEPDGGA